MATTQARAMHRQAIRTKPTRHAPQSFMSVSGSTWANKSISKISSPSRQRRQNTASSSDSIKFSFSNSRLLSIAFSFFFSFFFLDFVLFNLVKLINPWLIEFFKFYVLFLKIDFTINFWAIFLNRIFLSYSKFQFLDLVTISIFLPLPILTNWHNIKIETNHILHLFNFEAFQKSNNRIIFVIFIFMFTVTLNAKSLLFFLFLFVWHFYHIDYILSFYSIKTTQILNIFFWKLRPFKNINILTRTLFRI